MFSLMRWREKEEGRDRTRARVWVCVVVCVCVRPLTVAPFLCVLDASLVGERAGEVGERERERGRKRRGSVHRVPDMFMPRCHDARWSA